MNSCGNGPYAIRTVLDRVIGGPLDGNASVVNRVSVSKLEVMLNNQYKHDFNE